MKIPLLDLKIQYKSIKKEIDKEISEVFKNCEFILGKNVKSFEKEFAKYCGVKYAVAVGNGTDALYLALRACGIKKGDEVITSPFTFIATAEAITLNGAKPVFVDIKDDTFNINPDLIEGAITSKTKAIIPVHLFGQPANMDSIMRIAKKHKLIVIEDAAQAHGAKYNGKKAGSMGDAGIFSFFPAKNLGAYGDAGIIVTNNKNIFEKSEMLRDHGRKEKYVHLIEGINSRLDEIQAAVLRIKLRHLNNWNALRRKNARIYDGLLKDIKGITTPKNFKNTEPIYYFYVIRSHKRDILKEFLKKSGIDTGIHYPIPLHLQPAYKYLGYKKGDFPNAEKVSKEILSLPIYPELTVKQIRFIAKSIKNFLSNEKYLDI